jgi:hypothetical protein
VLIASDQYVTGEADETKIHLVVTYLYIQVFNLTVKPHFTGLRRSKISMLWMPPGGQCED